MTALCGALFLFMLLTCSKAQDLGLTSALSMAEHLTNDQISGFQDHRDLSGGGGERTLITKELFTMLRALCNLFKVFEHDKDGYISTKELSHVMFSMGEEVSEEKAVEKIKEADLDGDGRVRRDEFVVLMMPAVMDFIRFIQ